MVSEQIEREVVIDAPVDAVWAAVTEAEHVGAWFGESAEIDLQPDGRMLLTWSKYGTFHARIEALEPPRRFAFRWARPADTEPREGNSTLVEFTLAPEGESTRLRVVESGFPELEGTEAEREKYVADNTQGWKVELEELADYVSKQVVAPRG